MPRIPKKRWPKPRFKHERDLSFYKSKQWLALREERLQEDNYLCQPCKRKGLIEPAVQVHHKDDNRSYSMVPLSELESVCLACHRRLGNTT